ncbi:A24 family peptidase [Stenotrophomonas sp. GZD-301]|uniref:A24 family peptidase n=1 Tax=Stenotrophomonas sp. GZD-301 TaxID=3404814 RepID=UPI003BB52558
MSFLPLLALLLGVQVAISDLYARRVSNRALLLASVAAVAWLCVQWALARTGAPTAHLLGAAAGLVALLPFYAIGWMGAGDVKYFAVLGLLLGWSALLPVWIIASLCAGAHALCIYTARRVRPMMPLRLQFLRDSTLQHLDHHPAADQIRHARQGRVGIPFAAYLSLGALLWVVQDTYAVWP